MRKHFLLLLWLTLLPLAGWGANPLEKTGLTWTGVAQELATAGDDAGYNYRYYVTQTNTNNRPTYANTTQGNNQFNSQTSVNVPTGQGAGTYYVFWVRSTSTITRDIWNSNSTTGGRLVVTIAKAQPTVTLLGFSKPYQATGWAEPTVATMPSTSYSFDADGTNLTFANIQSALSWSRNSSSTDVGAYTYTLNVSSTNANYDIKVSPGTFTITAVDGNWTTTPVGKTTGNTAKYDGTDKVLSDLIATPAVYSGGTVEYSADGLAWSEDMSTIVVGKNAGNYSIQYRGNGDKNHNDRAGGSFNVRIDQYEITAEDFNAPTGLTKTYIEASQTIAEAATWVDGRPLMDEIKAGAVFWYPYSTTLTTGTNAQKYDVVYTIHVTDGNFVWKGGNVTLTNAAEIKKADLTPADMDGMLAENLVYTGSNLKLLKGAAYLPQFNGHGWSGTFTYYIDGVPVGTDWNAVVGKDADEDDNAYEITYTFLPSSGNVNAITEPQTIGDANIAKAKLTVSQTPAGKDGLIYDATNQKLLKQGVALKWGSADFTAFTEKYTLNGTDYTAYTGPEAKDADTYEIAYTITPTDAKNYKIDPATDASGTVPATIGKKGLDVAAQALTVNWTGTPVEAGQLIVVDDKDIPTAETLTPAQLAAALAGFKADEFKKNEGGNYTVVDPIPSDAGSYVFVLETIENQNYEINNFVPNGSLTIVKLPAVPATIAAADVTYNGDDQALVTVDNSTLVGGTMLYYLETEETGAGPIPAGDARWSEDVPEAINAGEYNVWTMVQGDKNHNDVVATATVADVKIKQKALAGGMFALTPDDLVYNGADQKDDVVITATDMNGEKNIITTGDFEETKVEYDGAKVEKLVNAGEYTYTFTGKGNYTGTATATIEIGQKELNADMFVFSADVEYNGEFQKPTITYKDEEPIVLNDDYTFAVTYGDPAAAIDVDKLIDADTYTFTFTATADGNYKNPAAPATVTKEWKITKKALTTDMFVLNGENPVVFDGTDQIPGFTLKEGEPIVEGDDFTYATTTIVEEAAVAVSEMIDADTYTYTFTATADGNYSGEVTIDFVINQATATIVEPEFIPSTYNGKDQALVTEATSNAVAGTEGQAGAEIVYQITDGEGTVIVDWTDDYAEIVQRNAGDYKVNYKITASEKNYTNPLVENTIDATINKATIGYNLGNLTKTWNGEPFSEEEIAGLFTLYAGGEGGLLFDGDEYDKPFTLDLPEDYRDAGTYTFKQPTVTFKEGKPVNYNVNFAGEAEIIINKADIVAPNPEKGIEGDFTKPTAIAGVVYNKTEQAIIEEGVVTALYAEEYPGKDEENKPLAGKAYGTMVYATAENAETWSEEAPKGTEAGGYTVYYKILGDKNHNDFEATPIEDVMINYATLTAEFLPEEYKTELPYKGAAYEATDFIPALEGIDLDEGYTVFAPEMINADEYTILYKGINNYEGEGETSQFTVTVKITPIDVIATAPTGVKKVYDGTTSLANAKIGEKALSNEDISFSGLISPDKIELPTELAMTTEGIKAGDKYAITVDPSKFAAANKNYNILSETIEGEVEITKAPAIKIGIATYPASDWTKVYGEADPEKLTGYTLAVTDGEVFVDDLDKVLEASTAKRAGGDDVDTYAVSLEFDETAEVFANYDGVSFDEEMTGEFTITKSTKTYTVSLANIEEIYNGEEFATAIEFTAEDLIIAGYDGDKAKFFDAEGLPTATLAAGAKDAGDYNITLSEGASTNYNFTFVPATFTIKPFNVTEATIASQKVQKGKELDVTKFTITAPKPLDEEGNEIDVFYVTAAAPGLVDNDDFVIGDAGVYPKGLVIAVDASVAANYTGLDKFTADLEIISAEAIILADNEDCKPEAQDGVDVTFASRTVNAGNWNVIALPFEATVRQISDAFGYAAVDILKEDNTAKDEVHFTVITSGSVPAYTPFLVKTTSDGEPVTNFDQVVFYNVNIVTLDDVESPLVVENGNTFMSDVAGNKFWGTFKAETKFWGKQYRYMSKGAWFNAEKYKESNPVTLKPFRGYLETASASARIFIEEPDGTVTAIDAVSFNKEAAEGMYNLNGVKVNNLNRKGVYIKNGVKVIK